MDVSLVFKTFIQTFPTQVSEARVFCSRLGPLFHFQKRPPFGVGFSISLTFFIFKGTGYYSRTTPQVFLIQFSVRDSGFRPDTKLFIFISILPQMLFSKFRQHFGVILRLPALGTPRTICTCHVLYHKPILCKSFPNFYIKAHNFPISHYHPHNKIFFTIYP